MISQKHSRHGVRPGSHLPTVGYLWLSYRAHGWHTEGSPKLTCIRCSWHSKESLSSGCTAAPTAPQQTQTLGARPSPGTSVHASRGHTTAPRRPQMGGGGATMPQRHAGGKTQFLLCAPAPPSYAEQLPTSLQPAPHQTHPEGSDAPGRPQALQPSAHDSSQGRDAQGQRRQRGGGCGSVTVLPRSPAPAGRAGTHHRPERSRHGPGDAHPDPDPRRWLRLGGSRAWT